MPEPVLHPAPVSTNTLRWSEIQRDSFTVASRVLISPMVARLQPCAPFSSGIRSLRRVRSGKGGGNVVARHGARRDVEAVPAGDGGDGQTQVYSFVLRELRPHAIVHLVRDARLGHQRKRFGPLQRGALARGVVRRFAPRVEAVEPLFALAVRPRILAVHVETI